MFPSIALVLSMGLMQASQASAQPGRNPLGDGLSVMTLGTGSPRYSEVRSRPATLVSLDGMHILVDMGTGTERRLNEEGVRASRIGHLLFTHHHIDHNAELPMLLVTASVRQSLQSVGGPAGTGDYVRFLQDFYMEDMLYRTSRNSAGKERLRDVEVRDLQGGESFEIGGLEVSTAPVEHTIHTLAYRFDHPGEGSVVVSGDLVFSPPLIELARDADILVIDSGGMPSLDGERRRPRPANPGRPGSRNADSRRAGRRRGPGRDHAHGTLEDAARMASEAGVATLVLTHIGVDRVDEAAVRERIAPIFTGRVEIGFDGGVYRVRREAAESSAAPAVAAQASLAGSYPIVDTGQTSCYDDRDAIPCPQAGDAFHGQDAQFAGNAPEYADNGDGTVTDRITGLAWQKSADTNGDGTIDAADKLSVPAATGYCRDLSLAGHDDWRLPTIKQLYSLIRFTGIDPGRYRGSDTSALVPFIDTRFFDFAYGDTGAGERVIDAQYASATRYAGSTGQELVFGVNFADGRIKGYPLNRRDRENTFFVACTRGNTAYGHNDFSDNGDGTISDRATGLMWTRDDSGAETPGGMNWRDALAWVQARNQAGYLGHDDWRLPGVKELQSLVDYSRSPAGTGSAAIDPLFNATPITNEAGETDYAHYWSSTTHANRSSHPGGAAAYVSFGRAMGHVRGGWVDVHGAGAQRSDPKAGEAGNFPQGRGPQGDAIRILNHVRLVRDQLEPE